MCVHIHIHYKHLEYRFVLINDFIVVICTLFKQTIITHHLFEDKFNKKGFSSSNHINFCVDCSHYFNHVHYHFALYNITINKH